ASAPWKIS
ncbi:hypothetical protein AB3S75_021717, partial [Citrus x aurantiifolia]